MTVKQKERTLSTYELIQRKQAAETNAFVKGMAYAPIGLQVDKQGRVGGMYVVNQKSKQKSYWDLGRIVSMLKSRHEMLRFIDIGSQAEVLGRVQKRVGYKVRLDEKVQTVPFMVVTTTNGGSLVQADKDLYIYFSNLIATDLPVYMSANGKKAVFIKNVQNYGYAWNFEYGNPQTKEATQTMQLSSSASLNNNLYATIVTMQGEVKTVFVTQQVLQYLKNVYLFEDDDTLEGMRTLYKVCGRGRNPVVVKHRNI